MSSPLRQTGGAETVDEKERRRMHRTRVLAVAASAVTAPTAVHADGKDVE